MKQIFFIGLLGISVLSANVFTDKRTGLMWQDEKGSAMHHDDAIRYCEELPLIGFDDWRLPSIDALKSIVDYTATPALIKGFKHRDTSGYWTATEKIGSSGSFWVVGFSNGNDTWDNDSYFVRCVRQ